MGEVKKSNEFNEFHNSILSASKYLYVVALSRSQLHID